jgi:hypothetical protein
LAAVASVLGLGSFSHAKAGDAKTPLRGLIDMGDISFHRKGGAATNNVAELNPYAGSFGGIAINVSWSQIEPTRGSLVTDGINHALADIRSARGCGSGPGQTRPTGRCTLAATRCRSSIAG